MQLRKKYFIFAAFTVAAVTLLWLLPQPHVYISPEGSRTENGYWWWFAGATFVIGGCFIEHLIMETFDHLNTRITFRQKATVQVTFLAIIVSVAALAFVSHGR
jgi:hypothetical protein